MLYNNWGEIDIVDVCSGAKHLIQNGVVDEDNIFIVGSSAGGYLGIFKLQTFKALSFLLQFCVLSSKNLSCLKLPCVLMDLLTYSRWRLRHIDSRKHTTIIWLRLNLIAKHGPKEIWPISWIEFKRQCCSITEPRIKLFLINKANRFTNR